MTEAKKLIMTKATSQAELSEEKRQEYLNNDFYYSPYYRMWIKASKKVKEKKLIKVAL
jgi:hypothetical protein